MTSNADNIRHIPHAAELAAFLRDTGRRCTPERFMVLEDALAVSGHFTAEELAKRMLDGGRRVALATVYSSLQLMVECGILHVLRLESGPVRYEAAQSGHLHLVCTSCGKIKDMRDATIAADLLRGSRYAAFSPHHFEVSVYGICSSCVRKARRNKKKKLNDKQ